MENLNWSWKSHCKIKCVWEVDAVGSISEWQPDGPELDPQPGGGLNFGWPSFSTDGDVEPRVKFLKMLT